MRKSGLPVKVSRLRAFPISDGLGAWVSGSAPKPETLSKIGMLGLRVEGVGCYVARIMV